MSWGNGLDKFDADLKEIVDLCSVMGVKEAHAACYLCNFEDEYICYTYDGGCKQIEQCRGIRERLQHI